MLNKPADAASPKSADKREPVVVKKYANRRLYNTETSTYVTLDDLASMVRAERDFVVYDAKSGDDLTHSVLTQIIVEQESRGGGQSMLPIPFLRQLIRFYGDSIGKMVPSYLQVSLDTLAKEQNKVREQFAAAFSPQGALEVYQEQARKNLAMFEQAMAMFTPFGAAGQRAQSQPQQHPAAPGTAAPGTAAPGTSAHAVPTAVPTLAAKPAPEATNKVADTQMAEMKAQMAQMQAMLEKLAKDRS